MTSRTAARGATSVVRAAMEREAFHTTKKGPVLRQLEREAFHTTKEVPQWPAVLGFLRSMERRAFHGGAERPQGPAAFAFQVPADGRDCAGVAP